mmetsp:Transcript_12288/g.35323  ORF Transcript_12288/g.35323 Transcript_12288/m.35323 type:complete len:214 (+) Transcript_12288:659-1300(+)
MVVLVEGHCLQRIRHFGHCLRGRQGTHAAEGLEDGHLVLVQAVIGIDIGSAEHCLKPLRLVHALGDPPDVGVEDLARRPHELGLVDPTVVVEIEAVKDLGAILGGASDDGVDGVVGDAEPNSPHRRPRQGAHPTPPPRLLSDRALRHSILRHLDLRRSGRLRRIDRRAVLAAPMAQAIAMALPYQQGEHHGGAHGEHRLGATVPRAAATGDRS